MDRQLEPLGGEATFENESAELLPAPDSLGRPAPESVAAGALDAQQAARSAVLTKFDQLEKNRDTELRRMYAEGDEATAWGFVDACAELGADFDSPHNGLARKLLNLIIRGILKNRNDAVDGEDLLTYASMVIATLPDKDAGNAESNEIGDDAVAKLVERGRDEDQAAIDGLWDLLSGAAFGSASAKTKLNSAGVLFALALSADSIHVSFAIGELEREVASGGYGARKTLMELASQGPCNVPEEDRERLRAEAISALGSGTADARDAADSHDDWQRRTRKTWQQLVDQFTAGDRSTEIQRALRDGMQAGTKYVRDELRSWIKGNRADDAGRAIAVEILCAGPEHLDQWTWYELDEYFVHETVGAEVRAACRVEIEAGDPFALKMLERVHPGEEYRVYGDFLIEAPHLIKNESMLRRVREIFLGSRRKASEQLVGMQVLAAACSSSPLADQAAQTVLDHYPRDSQGGTFDQIRLVAQQALGNRFGAMNEEQRAGELGQDIAGKIGGTNLVALEAIAETAISGTDDDVLVDVANAVAHGDDATAARASEILDDAVAAGHSVLVVLALLSVHEGRSAAYFESLARATAAIVLPEQTANTDAELGEDDREAAGAHARAMRLLSREAQSSTEGANALVHVADQLTEAQLIWLMKAGRADASSALAKALESIDDVDGFVDTLFEEASVGGVENPELLVPLLERCDGDHALRLAMIGRRLVYLRLVQLHHDVEARAIAARFLANCTGVDDETKRTLANFAIETDDKELKKMLLGHRSRHGQTLDDTGMHDGTLAMLNAELTSRFRERVREDRENNYVANYTDPLAEFLKLSRGLALSERQEFRPHVNREALEERLSEVSKDAALSRFIEELEDDSIRHLKLGDHAEQQEQFLHSEDFLQRVRLLPPTKRMEYVRHELNKYRICTGRSGEDVVVDLAGKLGLEAALEVFASLSPSDQSEAVTDVLALNNIKFGVGFGAGLVKILQHTDALVLSALDARGILRRAKRLNNIGEMTDDQYGALADALGENKVIAGMGTLFQAAGLTLLGAQITGLNEIKAGDLISGVVSATELTSDIGEKLLGANVGLEGAKAVTGFGLVKAFGVLGNIVGAVTNTMDAVEEFGKGDEVGGLAKITQGLAGLASAGILLAISTGVMSGPIGWVALIALGLITIGAMAVDHFLGESDDESFLKDELEVWVD